MSTKKRPRDPMVWQAGIHIDAGSFALADYDEDFAEEHSYNVACRGGVQRARSLRLP